ncbi:MAG: serine protease [Bacteroidetes bacterium HGW-Bacteroidetes-1]|jgi:hypothetical protein|nr:MAG: serine protease [Bacteroidetes bacterium HGW-Bacteroidetes-1]
MKAIFTLFFTIIIFQLVSGQIAPDSYFVQFTDKNNSPYNLNNPEAFLTQRAIERRQNQLIPLIENDLPVNPSYLDGVAQTGASLLFHTKWLNGVTIETTSQSVLDAIAALPYVSSIKSLVEEPLKQQIKNKVYFENETVSDEVRPENSGMKQTTVFDYGSGFTQINQINGIPLHEAGYRGQGMIIAILDGGFIAVESHIAFDSLWLNNQILGTKDFVHPGGSVFTESSHGTSVLSTIGSNIPGQLIGTAPKASFWLLRSEYVITEHLIEEYNWVSAAEFADSVGVDVINSSLGYIDFDYPQWNHTYEDMDGSSNVVTIGADIAASKGILVVNSAGNSGNSSSFPYIGAPADGFNVFSIGAVDGTGERASFSSIGPTYDGRIKPDVMAMGQGTAVAAGSTDNFTFSNGTSFSSPVMAGMATCLWQANRSFNNLQIKEAIMLTSSNASTPNSTFGYGIPDFFLANSTLTSIDTGEGSQKRLVEIFPNPFSSLTKIHFYDNRSLSFSLFDIQGRFMFQVELDAYQANFLNRKLNELKQGVYILQVQSADAMQAIRLIKN